MALNLVEQIKQLLEDKKNILITFGKQAEGDGDAVGSALAL